MAPQNDFGNLVVRFGASQIMVKQVPRKKGVRGIVLRFSAILFSSDPQS